MPPTKPYELSVLVADLVLLGRYLLKPNGRLVFFLPTVTDDYHEIDINTMLCDGMEVIANSLQDFGSWGRRVSDIPCVRRPLFYLRRQVGHDQKVNHCQVSPTFIHGTRQYSRRTCASAQRFPGEVFPGIQKRRLKGNAIMYAMCKTNPL